MWYGLHYINLGQGHVPPDRRVEGSGLQIIFLRVTLWWGLTICELWRIINRLEDMGPFEPGFIYPLVNKHILVGGLEHVLLFHILGIMIPTDFHIFQRGRNMLKPPTSIAMENHTICKSGCFLVTYRTSWAMFQFANSEQFPPERVVCHRPTFPILVAGITVIYTEAPCYTVSSTKHELVTSWFSLSMFSRMG